MEVKWEFRKFCRIFEIVNKFSSPNDIFPPSNYIFVDAKLGGVAVISLVGGVLYYGGVDTALENGVFPISVFSKVSSFVSKHENLVVKKLEDGRWKLTIGRLRVYMPSIQEVECGLPSIENDAIVAFSNDVFNTMGRMLFSVSKDMNRVNLYGIWYSHKDGRLYCSDNYRIVRTVQDHLLDNVSNDVFFPRRFLERTFSLDVSPEGFSSGNVLTFYYSGKEEFICYTKLPEPKMPPFLEVFEKLEGGKRIATILLDTSKSTLLDFSTLLREQSEWGRLKVWIEGQELLIENLANTSDGSDKSGSTFKLSIPVVKLESDEKSISFVTTTRFFLEALLRFNSFDIVSDKWLYFSNEEIEHIVYLVKGK